MKGGENTMKKFLFAMVLCATMLSMSAAHAGIIIKYDLSSVSGGALGQTGLFDREVLATVDATSTYASGIAVGSAFNDVGDLEIGNMTLSGATIANTQNLGQTGGWELTGRWTNLQGTLTAITPVPGLLTAYTFQYASGDAYLYAGYGATKDVTPAAFGAIGSGDDVASDFTDGTLLAHLQLISGTGSLNIYNSGLKLGSTDTIWKIVSVPAGVWLDAAGNDLQSKLEQYGTAEINTIVSNDLSIVGNQILSRNTGDATFNIPEPTTMLLLGSGLLGLAGFNIRRKRA